MKLALSFSALLALAHAGPAYSKILDGSSSYAPPTTPLEIKNSREYHSSYDATWKAVVAHLSDTSFVIDNIDKDSGLITVSFSVADPTSAIDCGQWTSWVKNLRGRRDYAWDGAAQFAKYEMLSNGTLATIDRKTSLSGKFNILVTSSDTSTTKVKVTTRYVPTFTLTVAPLILDMNFRKVEPRTFTESINFNTGAESQVNGQTICRAKGTLEGNLLNGFAESLK